MHVQDLEAIVEQLKPFLNDYLKEQGIETDKHFLCLFPEHKDSVPSSNLVGEGTRFYCHGCCRSGDIFDAVQILENKPKIGIEWVEETLKYLAAKYNVEVTTTNMTEEDIYKLDTYRAYRAASDLLVVVGQENNIVFQDELKRRQWKAEALTAMGIGVVPSYTEFRNALQAQGFIPQFLDEIGLNKKDLFHSDCLIYTWYDEKGRPVGFVARDMLFEEKQGIAKSKGEKHKGGKYTNTRTTKINIFQKGKSLYGLDKALEHTPTLYIFEGQPDVITARLAGLHNCVGIGGSAFRDDHIQLLKSVGVYDIVLCYDGDETGRKKLEQIIKEKFAGNKDIRVRIIELPDGEDPDSYIRKHGKKGFLALACWSAFEWKLNKYAENDDEIEICKTMIPYIVNEPSPIARDQMCKILAQRTGISFKAVVEELNLILDEQANKRNQERQNVLNKLAYDLRQMPANAESILQKAQTSLVDLVKQHDSDRLSTEDFVRSIDDQKNEEETMAPGDNGFKLGEDLKDLEEIFRGDWSEGTLICIGGKPNVGKTAFLSKLALSIAQNNEDVVVIYHTIDDTSTQLLPRFVTIGEGSQRLSINMVRQPNYWAETVGIEDVLARREVGYKALRALAQQARLIIKDVKHGSSLPFIESLICYYQERYPDKRVVFVLDNFHKLRDFEGKDERVRFKALSEASKNLTLRRRCCLITSVEYTKLPPGIKPTNNNIGETGQIEYDANAIIHIFNDVADNPHNFTVCHEDTSWDGKKVYLPRNEFIVGKNKITEVKKSFFLDFYPASSDFKSVDQNTVLKEAKEMKDVVKNMENGEFGQIDNVNNEFNGVY